MRHWRLAPRWFGIKGTPQRGSEARALQTPRISAPSLERGPRNSRSFNALSVLVLLLGLSACGRHSAQSPSAAQAATGENGENGPVSAAQAAARTPPPPPGLSPHAPFPTISRVQLDNGVRLSVIERHNLPIAEVRLLVRSGNSSDGEKAGVARLTGELLKAGGAGPWPGPQLVSKAEALGTQLDVVTGADSTEIALSVPAQEVPKAIEVLAAMAQKPRFSPVEFKRLKERQIEQAHDWARKGGPWAARMVLYRALFEAPTAAHPYAHYDASAEQLRSVELVDCRTWHKQHFVPDNAELFVVGSVQPEEVEKLAKARFGAWRGKRPPSPVFPSALGPPKLRVLLVDQPGAPDSEIVLGALGPERSELTYPALVTAVELLGGGAAGRLARDLEETRGLAYRAYATVVPLAHENALIRLHASTNTRKTPRAARALLEHFEAFGKAAPTPAEVERASRAVADGFLMQLETVDSIAQLAVDLSLFGLSDEYYDEFRDRVRALNPKLVHYVAQRYFKPSHALLVVTGDAKRLSRPLQHLAPVSIIEPSKGFAIQRNLPHDPAASLQVPEKKEK